ncbi:MAG: 4-hydroxythreonine-4-phosphate dehydrogenase PdxA [Vicinamibacterales bacterium]
MLALTPGEPAGIGPDICLKLAAHRLPARLVIVADEAMMRERATTLGLPFALERHRGDAPRQPGLALMHVQAAARVVPGELDPRNGPYVLATLHEAMSGCAAHRYDGMVTGPVNKAVINAAGIPFTGHTEFLAEGTGTARVVMMLAGGGMRVALATTHLALRDVADNIDRASLEDTLRILARELAAHFGAPRPRILVAGLNPHAGEAGYLGREEIEVIAPVLEKLRAEGMDLVGPLPADTLFSRERLAGCDAVLAMYHDQGLPVLKFASFGKGINVTLGLPIVRTSVDHGTALEIAGTGRADEGSLLQAIEVAAAMARAAKRR